MSETPFLHRVLRKSGYALTALLVIAAVGVLVLPFLPEPETPVAAPEPPSGSTAPSPPPGIFPDLSGGGQSTPPRQPKGPCGTQRAYYEFDDDDLKVTVVFPGVGAVRAVVATSGEPAMQSYTTAGDPTPHTFTFRDTPKKSLKKVGLTVTTASGAQNCELAAR
ncbi:hypothetical protein LO762_07170 [Actinocorallia sp. API 0066]|uniref:hypothetical protein n=1 Tax=Actinocorallia sp. API 0066 TaxID=2896846 RepID=UPI001E4D4939|nr:hypothetical protein [Actinocorallia sp. API 0066]MCD0448970.1 hypothetical protein [Actinocorallia sp. API 0066]